MADQTPHSATPAAAATSDPAASLAAQTAALAKEIAAEAQGSGGWDESEDSDVSAPETMADVNARTKPGKAASIQDDDVDDDDSEDGDPADAVSAVAAAQAGLPPELVAAVQSRDLEALAARLGIEDAADFFKVKTEDFKAIRHERKKLDESTTKLTKLEGQLREKYGDPVTARKAFQAGDLNAYFETLERWSGVPHAEVQKAWALHVQGKPVPKLEPKASTASDSNAQNHEKVTKLKERIAADIKTEPLAGTPGIVDRVFEKMRVKWNEGVRTPQAALKLVAADLASEHKQLRATLRKAGVIKGKPARSEAPGSTRRVVTPARGLALTQASNGAPGTTRPMSDRELAQDVMKGLGKDAWRA